LLPEGQMKTAVVFGLIVLSEAPTSQRNISGPRVVSQDRDFRGHHGKPADCTFTQEHESLTVRCSAAGVMNGQVHRTQVTWGIDMTDIPPPSRSE
jgi:hypothetical protein